MQDNLTPKSRADGEKQTPEDGRQTGGQRRRIGEKFEDNDVEENNRTEDREEDKGTGSRLT